MMNDKVLEIISRKASCRMMRFILFAAIALSAIVAEARDYTPEEIVNPNVADRYEYVADPERRLSASTRSTVNRRLQGLRDSTTAEVAVAVVPSIGDYSIEDFCTTLDHR